MLTKAERTKQFILETAAPIFNQKGISGVNIDDVLDAAKLTKGCLYGHFEGKEDLALQVVDFMLESLTRGDFYILCPDNDVPRPLDERRMQWAIGDIVENRPALSRWHPDYAQAFAKFVKGT